MNFDNVKFKGTFRDYQQRVLDRADAHLADGKINIVAAPGSGKTVLGLELIRRLGAPCIILSPTTAIRQQWGERFRDMFLDDESSFPALFSYDLHSIKLLNSITYQALYTSVERLPEGEDGRGAGSCDEDNCSDVDIFAVMKAHGIKTVCLDEAHHLKNEWQRALERFMSSLGQDVTVISLTATPPYDSEDSEWRRYTSICGEVDEEIFVPELVRQGTLCPHQDYIYFNYPTADEAAAIRLYRERAEAAVDELGGLGLLSDVCRKMGSERDYEALFSAAKEYIALAVLLRHCGLAPDRRLVRQLTGRRGLPPFSMKYAETAIRFLLDGSLLTEGQRDVVIELLRRHGVYERGRAALCLDERLRRTLVSSTGKLDSIGKIAVSESANLGDRLRMLVLTDFIKKEGVSKIGTGEAFCSVNVVSIFETLRRAVPDVDIGVLSGSLVILPRKTDLSGVAHRRCDIPGTDYCTFEFPGAVHRAVDCVGGLLEAGKIQILVGTKSLLGEGWDSPCINSLILASFVGSFVLSNQMRGRAIRIDRRDPDKTANIWHLVTLEPEHLLAETPAERLSTRLLQDKNELTSCDYDTLARRFNTFMSPNYTTGVIESGIGRITAIKPPYNARGVDDINAEMLRLSADRGSVRQMWRDAMADGSAVVNVETEVPKERRVPVFTFINAALAVMLSAAASIHGVLLRLAINEGNLLLSLCALSVMAVVVAALYFAVLRLVLHINPARSMKTLGTAVGDTLRECGLISHTSSVAVEADKYLGYVTLRLRDASVRDQNIFNTAITELLTPIQNPRYILIGKGLFGIRRPYLSFACPTVIGKKKEYVELLAARLKRATGRFEPVYTYREGGRQLILRCRRRSYVTINEKIINKKYRVSRWN